MENQLLFGLNEVRVDKPNKLVTIITAAPTTLKYLAVASSGLVVLSSLRVVGVSFAITSVEYSNIEN